MTRGRLTGYCMMAVAVVLWGVSLKSVDNLSPSLGILVAGFIIYYVGLYLAFYTHKKNNDE